MTSEKDFPIYAITSIYAFLTPFPSRFTPVFSATWHSEGRMKLHSSVSVARPISGSFLAFLRKAGDCLAPIESTGGRSITEKSSSAVLADQLLQFREKLLTHAGPSNR